MRDPRGEVKRYKKWLEIAGQLAYGTPGPADTYELIGTGLLETFDAFASTWNVTDADWTGTVSGVWAVEPLPDVPEFRRVPDPTWQPLLQWYSKTKEEGPQSIHAIPREVIEGDFKGEWGEFARPLQIERQMSIPLRLPGTPHCGFVLARPDDDFDEPDHELASLLQPLLTAALRQHAVLGQVDRSSDRAGLTDREFAVLSLLATGRTGAAIARQLGIAPRTVHKHLERIYRKLGVSDRVSALVRARELGLNLAPDQSPAD